LAQVALGPFDLISQQAFAAMVRRLYLALDEDGDAGAAGAASPEAGGAGLSPVSPRGAACGAGNRRMLSGTSFALAMVGCIIAAALLSRQEGGARAKHSESVDLFSDEPQAIESSSPEDIPQASSAAPTKRSSSSTTGSTTLAPLPAMSEGWPREHIGYFKAIDNKKCLGLDANPLLQVNATAQLQDCSYSNTSSVQRWVVDIGTGFIRSLLSDADCLDVEGNPGWKSGSAIRVRPCSYAKDVGASDQRWKFNKGGFIVNRLSGKCLTISSSSEVVLSSCDFTNKTKVQEWAFVGMAQVATTVGSASGRPNKALIEEQDRRHRAEISSSGESSSGKALLVLDDVTEAVDPLLLDGGTFWNTTRAMFESMSPEWNKWSDLMSLIAQVQEQNPSQGALAATFLANLISNMFFAGTNFVQGFSKPDLSFRGGLYALSTSKFGDKPSNPGCSEFSYNFMPFCYWPTPPEDEKLGVTSYQDYIIKEFKAHLPQHTFFETVFTGTKVPSWEDDDGHKQTISILKEGMAAARARGLEPMQVVRSHLEPRFAFDSEGLIALQEEGFGYFGAREVKYASNGANGVALMEKLMEKYGTKTDVLGVLMSETALSMHLRFDDSKGKFYVDLSSLDKYQPLPGYAKLGGRAMFEERDGRLVTTLLEYGGESFSGFDDEQSDKDYAESKLSGWRFAEKAIIASMLAKTQLLTHMKVLHLELAPALQVVTIDTLDTKHPLRRLMEPFTARSIQATQKNLQLWFEFRAGEFGLAPLPMEEQLKLLHETMETEPLNLADLDLERYAEQRSMSKFSSGDRGPGQWTWKWHQRALGFQQKVDELLDCWFEKHYENNDDILGADFDMSVWWESLLVHLPALRVAAAANKDWVVTRTITTTTTILTTAPPSPPPPPPSPVGFAPVPSPQPLQPFPPSPTPAPKQNFGQHFVPTTKVIEPPTTAAPPSSTVPKITVTAEPEEALPAAGQSTSNAGFFSVLSLHPQTTGAPTTQQGPPSESLAKEVPEEAVNLWRRLGISTVLEKIEEQSQAVPQDSKEVPQAPVGPVPDVATMKRVLRTLIVWLSWIHEDVGHSSAALIYNPVHTPLFVPDDGVGIPMVPLAMVINVYRSFVFVERAALLDAPAEYWFEHKKCKKTFLFLKSCDDAVPDKTCYTDFQEQLKQLPLTSSSIYSDCNDKGFYSCVDRVETSASS